MLHLVLLAIILTACPLLTTAAEAAHQVTLAVAIDDLPTAEAALVKYAVEKALIAIRPSSNMLIETVPRTVFLSDETSPNQLCEQIMGKDDSRPPTLLLDATTRHSSSGRRTSNLVKKLARSMGLPTVSTSYRLGGDEEPAWSQLSKRELEWLLHVVPPGDVIPNLVADISRKNNMTTAAILYDKTFDLSHKYTTLMETTDTRFVIQQLSEDIEGQLDKIKGGDMINYFVLGSMVSINKLLEAVQKKKMFGTQYDWNLFTKSRGKVKCLTCHLANVQLHQPMKATAHEYNHTSKMSGLTLENKVDAYFYYDLTRVVLGEVMELMSKNEWPAMTFPKCDKPEMSTAQINERKTMKLSRELALEGHFGQFGRFVFDHYVGGISYQDIVVKMVHIELWIDRPYSIDKLGEWRFGEPEGTFIEATYQEGGLKTAVQVTTAPKITEKGQPILRIVMILQPPFIMKRSNHTGIWQSRYNGTEYYGYCIDLIDLVQQKMRNKSSTERWDWGFELYEVPDGRFGEKVQGTENKWTGIIGELAEKRADIGLGPVAVMAERETVVDFTVPYYDLVGISILMKKASVPSHLFKFLTVLENDVWFSILAAYLVVSTLIFLYDRLSPFSYYNNKEGWDASEPKRRDFSFKECLWFGMTSLTPQGGGEAPVNTSGRVAAGTWWLFGFIVIASYTANLAAFLTVSRLDSWVESLDHLSDQFRIRYAPQERTLAEVYFQRMAHIEKKFYEIWKDMALNHSSKDFSRAKFAVWDYPISNKYTKMLEQMHQAGMPKHYAQGVQQTRASKSAQEGFAFIVEATLAKYAVLTHCDLTTIGNEFSRKPMALVVQQNSTLKDRLSSAILKLLNERKLEALKEHWWDQYRRICEDTKKSSDGISIHNIGGVFIVIFIGVILACITLVFEYIFLKRKNALEAAQNAVAQYNNIFKQNNPVVNGGGASPLNTSNNGLANGSPTAQGARGFGDM